MVNTGFHASFVNIKDNVPFVRVYKTKQRFVSAYKRMKDAEFTSAIDFNAIAIVKPDEINAIMEGQ